LNSKIKNSFIRYGLVGVISALIDFILVIILFYVFKSNELLAITIGFSISSIFNYLAHKSFSFNARDISHHKSKSTKKDKKDKHKNDSRDNSMDNSNSIEKTDNSFTESEETDVNHSPRRDLLSKDWHNKRNKEKESLKRKTSPSPIAKKKKKSTR